MGQTHEHFPGHGDGPPRVSFERMAKSSFVIEQPGIHSWVKIRPSLTTFAFVAGYNPYLNDAEYHII